MSADDCFNNNNNKKNIIIVIIILVLSDEKFLNHVFYFSENITCGCYC